MGHARFTASNYINYRGTVLGNNATTSINDEFKSRKLSQSLDPKKAILRESRDSDLNPESTPIIIAVDVTGSMGFIPNALAKEELPKLFTKIYTEKPVTDPHVMIMGIGDAYYDQAPLQVSQFEAGEEQLASQLSELYLERGGGGNDSESYELAWHFAANRTSIDSFEKRGKKGFIFTIGDELPNLSSINNSTMQNIYGPDVQYEGNLASMLEDVKKQYTIFHIIAEEGSFYRSHSTKVREAWTKILGNNVLYMKDYHDLSDIINATLSSVSDQSSIDDIIIKSQKAESLRYAFSNALR